MHFACGGVGGRWCGCRCEFLSVSVPVCLCLSHNFVLSLFYFVRMYLQVSMWVCSAFLLGSQYYACTSITSAVFPLLHSAHMPLILFDRVRSKTWQPPRYHNQGKVSDRCDVFGKRCNAFSIHPSDWAYCKWRWNPVSCRTPPVFYVYDYEWEKGIRRRKKAKSYVSGEYTRREDSVCVFAFSR